MSKKALKRERNEHVPARPYSGHAQRSLPPPLMPLDLDDDDKAALVELLRETIERDRFPLSPRVKRLRGILAKLGVGSAPAVPYPPPEPPGERSMALARKRRR